MGNSPAVGRGRGLMVSPINCCLTPAFGWAWGSQARILLAQPWPAVNHLLPGSEKGGHMPSGLGSNHFFQSILFSHPSWTSALAIPGPSMFEAFGGFCRANWLVTCCLSPCRHFRGREKLALNKFYSSISPKFYTSLTYCRCLCCSVT